MPKKTKSDKFEAAERRKKLAEKLISYKFVKPQSQAGETSTSNYHAGLRPESKNIATKSQISMTFTESSDLKKDLFKILIFTVFAVICQVVIYYFHRG